MASVTTSATLLFRVRDPADRAAWREFDARYGDLIVRYARRSGLQHCDAEDLRQAVMLRLFKAMPAFQYEPQRGRFRSFLGRIVFNEIVRRGLRPKLDSGGVDENEDLSREPAADADPAWEREWMNHHVRVAMQCVRQTFDRRSVEAFERLLAGQTIEQVAHDLEMSAAGVHKVKQRVRERLRELVMGQIRAEDHGHEQSPDRAS